MTRLGRTFIAAALALLLTGAAASAATPAFKGGPLPAAPDIGLEHNLDSEPGMAVSPDGTFWVGANIDFDKRRGVAALPLDYEMNPTNAFANSDVWRSTDGGRTYEWVAAPFGPLHDRPGLGGNDTDVAVAGARNAGGFYNVYVASLWIFPTPESPAGEVGDIDLAISPDAGKSWIVDRLAASVPADDRPWLAADGACGVYVAYHAGPTNATVVNRYDLCHPAATAIGATLTPVSSSRYPALVPGFAQNHPGDYTLSSFGKPAVDTSSASPYRHRFYLPVRSCGTITTTEELARRQGDGSCPRSSSIQVLMSPDRGRTWTLEPVWVDADRHFHGWSTWIATDAAGAVYVVWWNRGPVYMATSRDGGRNWSPPRRVSAAPSATGVMATVTASAAGVVEVAWYGTDRAGEPQSSADMGDPGAANGAAWSVYWARSTDAGHTFTQALATSIVHRGTVCLGGFACGNTGGGRNLYDDFGIAISPLTGCASITYDSDQPSGTAEDTYVGYATQERSCSAARRRRPRSS